MHHLKMTFKLTENIDVKFQLDAEKFITTLKNYSTTDFQMFPDKPLTGEIVGNAFSFKINPPLMIVDPFRSLANGQVCIENGINHLQVKISPSWTILAFLTLWFILIILFFSISNFTDNPITFCTICWTFTLILLPIVLTKIKIIWDKRRLKKLLDAMIKKAIYKE